MRSNPPISRDPTPTTVRLPSPRPMIPWVYVALGRTDRSDRRFGHAVPRAVPVVPAPRLPPRRRRRAAAGSRRDPAARRPRGVHPRRGGDAVALTALQRSICQLLAASRLAAGESYVAGGVALNELLHAPRLSHDIDLFHDTDEALARTW